MSFPRHTKIYQSDEPEGGRTNGSTSLGDHRSDESSAGYSFVGCSPAEPASASPTATSLSQHPAAVNCSAAKRNLSPFFLSHLRGPLHRGAVQGILLFLEWTPNGGTGGMGDNLICAVFLDFRLARIGPYVPWGKTRGRGRNEYHSCAQPT